jgi:hypothetical protein
MQPETAAGRLAMRRHIRTLTGISASVFLAAFIAGQGVLCCAQTSSGPTDTQPKASQQSATPQTGETPAKPDPPVPHGTTKPTQDNAARPIAHHFWDQENDWLFAGVAASRTLDYFSTLNMRRRGRQEILLTNDVVDNHAAFAAIEAAGTGASMGVSYLFHRYQHHKLERWTSIVHIGLTTTGAVRNYCLKTAHVEPATSSP